MAKPGFIRFPFLTLCMTAFACATTAIALEPFPYAATVSAVRPNLRGTNFVATALHREDYLKTIGGIVRYFHHFQTKDGRIVDPFLHHEVQYATPCYACAASALVVGDEQTNLLESAALALDNALQQLAEAKACDNHGDFFTVPCMFAYENLRDRVTPRRRQKWEQWLREMDPFRCYRMKPRPNTKWLNNWNVVSAVGEFLRHNDGFTGMDFVEQSLAIQMRALTSSGMYRDGALPPMAYDLFPRHYLAILLERGYDGRHRKDLAELMRRATWMSLLMQSPLGELPTGGRSAQHQWNEAQQCVTYEIFALRARRDGDEAMARACKRAAHLALQSVNRWIRPSGELNIVKNHFDPAVRHGFESYSSHSQYNLLAASMLATAWSFADDTIPEGRCPAEVGGFVIHIPEFHKIFANAGGMYVEIDTGANPHYNSTGLIRIHKSGVNGLVGPSDSAPASVSPLAVGVAWWNGHGWTPLAALTADSMTNVSVAIEKQAPSDVRFSVNYPVNRKPIRAVREKYELTPDMVRVGAEVEGDTSQVQVRFPALVFDGEHASDVTVTGSQATVRLGGSEEVFRVETPLARELKIKPTPVSSRNGFLEAIEGVCNGNRVVYTLKPKTVESDSPDVSH